MKKLFSVKKLFGSILLTLLITTSAFGQVRIRQEWLPAGPDFTWTNATVSLAVGGDMAVNGGDLTSTATTFNLLNATVTTGNLFGAGTANTIGATTGYTNIRSILFINDTANTFMTKGITVQQDGADNEIQAWKSSDIAHGITSSTENDTFLALSKSHATNGGGVLQGFSSATKAVVIHGTGTTDNTAKTTAALGYITLKANKKSGTTEDAVGTDANMVVIESAGVTQFIFDAEGSGHANVEWIAFDKHDDLKLLTAMEHEFAMRQGTVSQLKANFGEWLSDYKHILQQEKIVNFYDTTSKRAMVNFTRLAMLHTGAIREVGRSIEVVNKKLTVLINHLGLDEAKLLEVEYVK